MKFVDLKQNTPEWLEFRKTHIGASDAPIIMGVSPWCTPRQLWEKKLGLRDDSFDSSAMKRGRDLEDVARLEFLFKTQICVAPAVVECGKLSWMSASFDGIDDTHKHIVEIKCPGKEDHQKALDNNVPEKYYPQLQHQMFVADVESMSYFSFDGKEGVLVDVRADQEYQSRLIEKENNFWNCLINKTPPELTDRDFIQREDISWATVASQYLEAATLVKLYEEKEKALRNTLIGLAGENNVIGAGLRLSKVERKGAVDYNAIPEIKGLDLEQFRKPATQYWKIGEL